MGKGLRRCTHSIRINQQGRLCFRWGDADTALRLERYFGAAAEAWTGLQADYELRLARYQKEQQIEQEVESLARVSSAVA